MQRAFIGVATSLLLLWPGAALAQGVVADAAVSAALATFEKAWPKLGKNEWGVDGAAYRDALSLLQFRSNHWGGDVAVTIETAPDAGGSCGRFAAYTLMPPSEGRIRLVLCPQFFTSGADGLRELTILHEMVHVVAGEGECRAMAYAARIQQAAHGSFTPVDGYWQASGCAGGPYALPR